MTRDAHALAIRIVADRAWKRCSCGRGYSEAEWNALPVLGVYEDEIAVLTMKDCVACRSTMARERVKPANDGGTP